LRFGFLSVFREDDLRRFAVFSLKQPRTHSLLHPFRRYSESLWGSIAHIAQRTTTAIPNAEKNALTLASTTGKTRACLMNMMVLLWQVP